LENFQRTTSPARGNFDGGYQLLTKYKAEGDGIQEWLIEIPANTVTTARAMLATEQFPKLPPIYVAVGALSFWESDKDGNQELSKEEYPTSRSFEGLFTEFPVAFPAFVEAYAESRASRNASRFSRGP
jgi:hypothetical protein